MKTMERAEGSLAIILRLLSNIDELEYAKMVILFGVVSLSCFTQLWWEAWLMRLNNTRECCCHFREEVCSENDLCLHDSVSRGNFVGSRFGTY